MKSLIKISVVIALALLVWSSSAQTVNDSIVKDAKTNANKSDYEKAMESLDQLIKKWEEEQNRKIIQTNTDSILELANKAAENENYNEAIEHVITVRNIWEERHQLENPPNMDSIFNVAVVSAREKKYDKARRHADMVLEAFPDRADVLVFKANIDAWESKFDSADVKLNKAYKLDHESVELYDSWLNVHLWDQEYRKLLDKADLAEENDYPKKENLTLKRVYAYNGLLEYDSALAILARFQLYQIFV